jgi:hypothetical protein
MAMPALPDALVRISFSFRAVRQILPRSRGQNIANFVPGIEYDRTFAGAYAEIEPSNALNMSGRAAGAISEIRIDPRKLLPRHGGETLVIGFGYGIISFRAQPP